MTIRLRFDAALGAVLLPACFVLCGCGSEEQGNAAASAPAVVNASPGEKPGIANGGQEGDPFSAPIHFSGKILDQNGDAVRGAIVRYFALNDPVKPSGAALRAGDDGTFQIETKGASIVISVSCKGYRRVPRGGSLSASEQVFDIALGWNDFKCDPANPVLFHLAKTGVSVPLDAIARDASLPVDGTATTLVLNRRREPSLVIRLWAEERDNAGRHFPWRVEFSVQGGKLQEVQKDYERIAPESGYVDLVPFATGRDSPEWTDALHKNFWVHFPDDTYGRIAIDLVVRKKRNLGVDGVRNPSPGDRNLEGLGGTAK